MQVKVFDYINELDCFVVRKEFQDLMEESDLAEWNPVVWIGRLFARNQVFSEHWLDNWDERQVLADLAKEKGIDLGVISGEHGWGEPMGRLGHDQAVAGNDRGRLN